MDHNEILNHPYLTYVGNLNMTECYKLDLLAGNDQFIQYVPEPQTYRNLRRDFEQKYPEAAEMMRKESLKRLRHADCIIL